MLTLKNHSLFNAFFEPAVLASVTLGFCNFTCAICYACVDTAILHGPLEEAFTSVVSKAMMEYQEAQQGKKQVWCFGENNENCIFLLGY